MGKLENGRWERFCQEYAANGDKGKKAAIAAKYSPKTAESQASRLLRNVKVRERIAELKKPIQDGLGITAEYGRDRLKKEAERESKGASHAARIRALELLGKDLGMFAEKDKGDDGPTNEDLATVFAKMLSATSSGDAPSGTSPVAPQSGQA